MTAHFALHREATIKLPKAFSSNNSTTTDIYDIGTRDLATFEYDCRRSTASGVEYVQVRGTNQELFLKQTVTFNDLFTLSIQDAGKCSVFQASKNEEGSTFHTPVFALANLTVLIESFKHTVFMVH